LIFNLRVLDVLANLGYMNDERLNDAAEILTEKIQRWHRDFRNYICWKDGG